MAGNTPASPAPVSGPGALSRRTDNGPAQKLRELPNAQYGEAKTFRDLQRGAPLAQENPVGNPKAPPVQGAPTGATPSIIPLNAPTTRPNEPITTGSNFGPGAGPEVLGPAANSGSAEYTSAKQLLSSVAQASGSGEARSLLAIMGSRL